MAVIEKRSGQSGVRWRVRIRKAPFPTLTRTFNYKADAEAWAKETAMRRGELLSLSWDNIDLYRRTAHLPMTKNATSRNVPLSSRAIAKVARCAFIDTLTLVGNG